MLKAGDIIIVTSDPTHRYMLDTIPDKYMFVVRELISNKKYVTEQTECELDLRYYRKKKIELLKTKMGVD